MIYIAKNECVHRGFYKINSRNLKFGIYNASNGGFYGIRTKFEDRYVFAEYHYDKGAPYGTVKPLKLLQDVLPSVITVRERMPGYFCVKCQRPLKDENNEVYKHYHLDNVACEAGDLVHGNTNQNKQLFDWLENRENFYLKNQVDPV